MISGENRINYHNVQDILALTPMQEGMLFHYLMNPDDCYYFEQLCITVRGKIDLEVMRKAWSHVLDTNEMLRTIFKWNKLQKPVQIIFKHYEIPLSIFDISNFIEVDKMKKVEEIKRNDSLAKIDISTEPYRLTLIKLSETECMLLISYHHILFDGWSTGIILKEFFQTYNVLGEGLIPAKIKKNSFKEFIKWLNLKNHEELKNYWTRYLVNFDNKTLLPELPNLQDKTVEIKHYIFTFEEPLTSQLNQFAAENRITLASIIYTVWGILLQRYNNTDDIVFGTTVSGRNADIKDLEEMVGLFINTIPLRVKSDAEQIILTLLKEIDRVLKERTEYENVPLVEIKSFSGTDTQETLFDSIVVIENYPLDKKLNERSTNLQIVSYSMAESTNFDLSLAVELSDSLVLNLGYKISKFDEQIIQRISNHFKNILVSILYNPFVKLSTLTLLSSEEKDQLLYEFNDTAVDYPKNKTIHQLFAEQVKRDPEQIAVVYEGQQLTYSDLNMRANCLADILRMKGVKADELVGIIAERSVEMIVGIVAILKSGGAYLPIDPDYPAERIKLMLEDCSVNILLTQGNNSNMCDHVYDYIDILDPIIYKVSQNDANNLSDAEEENWLNSTPENLAYVIYTSGSTGKPKGVMIEHKSVVRLVQNTNFVEFRREDKILQTGTLTFDASTFEIWGSLLNGLELHLGSKDLILNTEQMEKYLVEHSITTMFITPALFNLFADEKPSLFQTLSSVLIGGDTVSPKHINRVKRECKNLKLVNAYGPTENTTFSTCYFIDSEDSLNIPIGKPINNSTAYIFAKDNHLCPIGVTGELCVGGDGLARGYITNPALTAEKFILNPFTGERLYRTGDYARWLSDGNIEFQGRIDHQVKIRGFRIEPGEIESNLLSYAPIKEAIVIDRKDAKGNKYLCGYIVAQREVTISEVREYLAHNLPGYMIPAYIVQLVKMPLNKNGKIDRKALPEPEGLIVTGTEFEAPRNQVEEKLASIWIEILGLEKVSINDNFFELGGHSLRAMMLISKIHKELNIELSLREVFKQPTIKELAAYLQESEATIYASIQPVVKKEYYELSSAQKRMYMLQQFDVKSTLYNIPAVFIVDGDLDIKKLESVFNRLIQRHETLRTSFITLDDKVVQLVIPQVEFKVEYHDIANAGNAESITEAPKKEMLISKTQDILAQMIDDFVRPFELSEAPLFRVAVNKLNASRYLLLFDMHHIISDGTSLGILINEFIQLYVGKEVEDLRIQYKDYAEWQNSLLRSAMMQKQEEYWMSQFADEIPVLNLPTDYPRPVVQNYEGSTISFAFAQQLSIDLKRVATATGTTLYMVLLAGLNILFSRYSGQEDIIIGSPIAGRPHADLEKIIGMFVNTLAIRNQPKGIKNFEEFLLEVKENALNAYEHQDYQFEELIEHLNLSKDLSRNPLFDVMFALQNMNFAEVSLQNAKFTPYPYETKSAKFDLLIQATEIVDQISFLVDYSTKLFKKSTVEQMFLHYANIMKVVVENQQVKISEIDILTEEEKFQLLYEFNDTYREYPDDKTLDQLFIEQVLMNPDQVAVVFEEKKLTYRELDNRANTLAKILKTKGVTEETLVGIVSERSLVMVIGLVAILKAGGAYLPIDSDYPEERVKLMLDESSVSILLTQGNLKGYSIPCEVIDILDETLYTLNDGDDFINRVSNNCTPNNLAYVMYTSGSTGKPKGVMIEQRSIVRLVKNTNFIRFTSEDKILQTGTLAFDASTFEIWGALLNGLELHIGTKELILSSDAMHNYILDNKITILWLTAPLFQLLVDERPDMFKPLRYLLSGGDVLSVKHVNKVRNICEELIIINGYGPTENTTFSTCFTIEGDYTAKIPIGKPIANSTCYIFDKYNNLCPVGVYGEICVSGDGLARGYINPTLTAERFGENPVFVGERIYRTGDVGRWLPDGNIEFLGRMDFQVKIRGYRIEPSEIENCLIKCPMVKEAVVIVHTDEHESKYLCAYVVTEIEMVASEIRAFLAQHLPDYMLPLHFVQLDKMPLKQNGKVDRNALPEPIGIKVTGVTYEAPRNELETKIARIWVDVLGVERVGINDNFFELGGHSLKATILASKIHKEMNVELPLREVFHKPTIKELASYIQNSAINIYASIQPIAEKDYYETSSAQKRMYMLQQFDLTSTYYNIPSVFIIEGKLDIAHLNNTINAIIARHETLRTSFLTLTDKVVQCIDKEIEFAVEYIEEVSTIREESIGAVVKEFVKPFELSKAPLFRVRVIRLAVEKYLLMFDIHHIISDGTSMGVLVKELANLYEHKALEELRIQYKDYAEWQNKFLTSELIQRQEEYWLNQFCDEVPVLNLPTDFGRPMVQSLDGATLNFFLAEDLTERLKQIARITGSTLYMVLLSGINILLARYSGQEDIVVGSPIAGRPHADLEKIIGMFVNTLAMRNQPEGRKTYEEFLDEVRDNALKAFENQDFQFEELVERLQVRKDLSRNPLFDVMFTLQNMDSADLCLQNLTLIPQRFENKTAKLDLTIIATEIDERIALDFEYSTKLFKEETIKRMFTHLQNIFQAISVEHKIKLSAITMLSEEERAQILDEFNDTYREYPKDKTIHQIFAEVVARVPERTAVIFAEQKLTYRELDMKATELASCLSANGVKEGSIVGVMAERSLEMIIGFLAILKAGGAYLPIDPEYPEDRIRMMIEDCAVKVILTKENQLHIIDQTNLVPTQLLENSNTSESLAYVMYTSGSTGKPKGVLIEHKNVVNLVIKQNIIDYTEEDKLLQTITFTFDPSTFEIWGSLLNGVELHLCEKELLFSTERMEKYLIQNHISIVVLSAPLFYTMVDARPGMFRTLKYLVVGGDVLSPIHVEKVRKECPELKIVNGYGPTENTVFSTSFTITQEYQNIPIGKPIRNSAAYILDQYNNLNPIGIYGELCVGGEGLARGYLNNHVLTAEKFVANPFVLGAKMYRTGDLVRWLPDGNIEFLGRIDQQVKIRGFRIEFGEIETCLLKNENIQEVIVIDRKDASGSKYLCAYLVLKQKMSINEIRSYLAEMLPNYMIPSHFVILEKLPLKSSGKLDRSKLPEPSAELTTGVQYIAPRNETEEKLVTIWSEVLGIAQVGIIDNFFELGGHSLKATILITRIKKEFSVELSLRQVFTTPTIEELAEYIAQSMKCCYDLIEPLKESEYYLVSSAQKRLLYINQLEDSGVGYNMPGALFMDGKIDLGRLEKTFSELIRRHEAFRTTFTFREGEAVQLIHHEVEFAIHYVDEEDLLQQGKNHQQWIHEFIRPFDLTQAPLLRVGVIKLAKENEQYILIYDMHHIISDGLSMEILVREFVALYNGEQLPELRIQYKDFSQWQNDLAQTDIMKNQEKYWLNTFADEIPVLNMPTDYPRPTMQSFKGSTVSIKADNDLALRVKNLMSETGSTMYMVLLGAYNVLLYKYTGQEDIIIGSPIAGRHHADLENIIGMFVNMLALRNNPSGSKTFTAFLSEVKDCTLKAYDNQDYQFGELVGKLNLRRDLSRNPLFDVVFSMHIYSERHTIETDELKFRQFGLESNIAKFDITLNAEELPEGFIFSVEYCTDLFTQDTMTRLLHHYVNILDRITNNPQITIGMIDMLSEEEKQHLLVEYNRTQVDYPKHKTMHQLFEEQVERTPENIALILDAQQISYRELNEKANQLARILIERGIQVADQVGIIAERRFELIVGLFAILKAGAAYVPIDPTYPITRQEYIAQNSMITALVVDQEYELTVPNTIRIDYTAMTQYPVENLNLYKDSTELAYIIYTSGSTGLPKGVMIEHHSAVNLILWVNTEYQIGENDALLFITSVCFDLSVYDIFGILAAGGRVVIAKKEQVQNPEELRKLLKEKRITFWDSVPTTMNHLVTSLEESGEEYVQTDLRVVFMSGDWIPVRLPERLKQYFPQTKVISLGGATEGTVWSIYYPIEKVENNQTSIPYGRPLNNNYFYILDKDLNPVPLGVPGELYIGGVGVARGYINNPDRTAKQFLKNAILTGDKQMMYRTGDLGRMMPDYNIEFLGRADHQVKIRGFRVEMGEIEYQILKHPLIKETVIIDRKDSSGNKYLCAYLVAEEEIQINELREFLAQSLPDYMLPTYFIQLPVLPLTSNGKIDRKALPEPGEYLMDRDEYVAPQGRVEERLATIWQEVLEMPRVGALDNFFELGGHSLKATTLVAQVNKEFQIKLPLKEVFKSPTVRELAKFIEDAVKVDLPPIVPVERKSLYPVSSSQKRLLIQHQLYPNSISYNLSLMYVLEDILDYKNLENTFKTIIERQASFRTSFVMVDGEFMQRVHENVEFTIQYLEAREEDLDELTWQFIRPFDLQAAPLFRVALVKFANKHLLMMDMHHIITDGVSLGILTREFTTLFTGGNLPSLPIQYVDFAVWQKQLFLSGVMKKEEEYWLQQLSGMTCTRLPVVGSRLVRNETDGQIEYHLSAELIERMEAYCNRKQITKFILLLTIFKIVLAKATDEEDLTLGIPIAGRTMDGLDKLIGLFLNVLLIRTKLSNEMTFAEYLETVKTAVLEAQENQAYPFEELYARLREETGTFASEDELFSIMFNYLTTDINATNSDFGNNQIKPYRTDRLESKYDVTLYAQESGKNINLYLVYKAHLYEKNFMESLISLIAEVLETILADDSITLATIGSCDTDNITQTDELAAFAVDFDNDDFIF